MLRCCESGNELLSSMKYCEYVEWLSNCWLLLKDSLHGVEIELLALRGSLSLLYSAPPLFTAL
jgi:hypothetical protein